MVNNRKINRDDLRSWLSARSQEIVLIALILVVSILVQLRTDGSFLSASNLNEMMRETSMLMIVSIGWCFGIILRYRLSVSF